MQLKSSLILVSVIVILCLSLSIGCSRTDPATLVCPPEPIIHESDTDSGNLLAGSWDITVDFTDLSVEMTHGRNIAAHYNVTPLLLPPNCADCLVFVINSFDPVSRILDLDVTVKNPTALSVYDMRGILHTNDAGHELQNYDEWTGLYDMPGGDIINPFRAFCKDQAGRLFGPSAEHTENYLIYVPDPPDYYMLTYAITISWPGNCNEPYRIDNFSQLGPLYDSVGSDADIQVDVFDWQYDTDQVKVSVPEITGEEFTPLSLIYATTWGATLTNNTGALAGEYDVKIIAGSANSGTMELIDFATVTVTEGIPANPIDVTPPNLYFENVLGVVVEDGYAYVADYEQGLVIADIDPLLDAHLVSIVAVPYAWEVGVHEGFAYVIDFDGDFVHIIDVDPLETAYIVCMVPTNGARDIAFAGDYAYVAARDTGLIIIDIHDPVNAFISDIIPLGGQAFSVVTEGNYAYIANRYGNSLQIVDISPPGTGMLVHEIICPFGPYDLDVQDGMAYVTSWSPEFGIIDVDPPESAYIVNIIPLDGGNSMGIDASGGYAYIGNFGGGPFLEIVDIDPIETAHTYNITMTQIYPWKVVVHDNYAYIADGEGGLVIFQLW